MKDRELTRILGHLSVSKQHLTSLDNWSNGDTSMSLLEVERCIKLARQYQNTAIEWLKLAQQQDNGDTEE